MADARLTLYRKSARNVRRINRTLQTTSEKLERWLDRAVKGKRIDVTKVRASATPLFDAMKTTMRDEEAAITDMVNIAAE